MRIAGTGCCLLDLIYPRVDFSSEAFGALLSKAEGDGGLVPGGLVFADDAEAFARRSGRPGLASALDELGCSEPAAVSIGGPSIVSLIHASQMLEGEDAVVSFAGALGEDGTGRRLRSLLAKTSVDLSPLRSGNGRTPSTYVLSDPSWDGGRGERCFINDIGAAARFGPADLGDDFTGADIAAFGGTALVPAIHEALPDLLSKARSAGALTLVNTVFDFRAERRYPGRPWSLGGGGPGPGPAEAYRSCDLLIMDRDEALRLSGRRDLDSAIDFFIATGVSAFAITRGPESVLAWAGGGRFRGFGPADIPVLEVEPSSRARGDTTGCGDAFAGGIIAALAARMMRGSRRLEGVGGGLDLADAISWGVAAGAFTLSILGGVYYESRPGEKRELVAAIREAGRGPR